MCTAFFVAVAVLARPALAYDQNPIRAENALPGTPLPLASDISAPAPAHSIEGYTSEVSVAPGDVVHLHVSTGPPELYRVEIYRLGWYGGVGARRVACLPGCGSDELGSTQAVPEPDASGEVRAGWPVTDVWSVPQDAVTGYYVARLLLTSGEQVGKATLVPFVVRAPKPAPPSTILVQVPVNTWQAYNNWGGKSLYSFNSTNAGPAVRVSFDRPYTWAVAGSQALSAWEIPLVHFLEREGYDVSYQTDVDTDRDPTELERHRLVMTAGHGEYWTKVMRDAFEAALGDGTNLAFMGANTGYWQVRYEDGGRTMVSYKSLSDPEPDPALKTALFRELTPPRYECELLGVQHQGGKLDWNVSDYAVNPAASNDPWFANTGFAADSAVTNIVSEERDQIPAGNPPGWSCGHPVTVLFHHEGDGGFQRGDAVRYVDDSSGARVFSTGSLIFSWGLDAFRAWTTTYVTPVDARLQQFMRNALDDLSRPAPTPAPYSPSLTITRNLSSATGASTTNITFSQTKVDAPTARLTILSPAGFSATVTAGGADSPGTFGGTAVVGADGETTVPVTGSLFVADPTNPDVTAAATQCTGQPSHSAIWGAFLTAGTQRLDEPLLLYVDAITTTPLSPFASASIQFCLPHPSEAPLGIKLLTGTLHIEPGIFTPPAAAGDYPWIAMGTPFTVGGAHADLRRTVETVSIERSPIVASLRARRITHTRKLRHKNKTEILHSYSVKLRGRVRRGSEAVAGANAEILDANDKPVASMTTDDNGSFAKTLTLGKTTSYRVRFSKEAEPLVGGTCQPQLPIPGTSMPAACGSSSSAGLTATSAYITVKKPRLNPRPRRTFR